MGDHKLQTDKFTIGSASKQGRRESMEDTHVMTLNPDSTIYCAVYDGHGSPHASDYARLHLRNRIINSRHYTEGRIAEAIKEGCLVLDSELEKEKQCNLAGSTAIITIIKDDVVYCGNIGDSRAVASIDNHAQALSTDHKPDSPQERKRIIAAEGTIIENRVDRMLAMSRALGDFYFKEDSSRARHEQKVTACADVTELPVNVQLKFVLLASDGIYDTMGNQSIVDYCTESLATGKEPKQVCEELIDRCYSHPGDQGGPSEDNMTAILICPRVPAKVEFSEDNAALLEEPKEEAVPKTAVPQESPQAKKSVSSSWFCAIC